MNRVTLRQPFAHDLPVQPSDLANRDQRSALRGGRARIEPAPVAQAPMVVFLHCFGCPPANDFGWNAAAAGAGYVLLRPLGVRVGNKAPSWNGGACCGDARDQVAGAGLRAPPLHARPA